MNRLLEPKLRAHPHVCWSSEEVQIGLKNAAIGPSTVWLKYDIKEFFLSGDHETLASLTAKGFTGELRNWVEDCVFFLLRSQFVEWKWDPDSALVVTKGSGMGMKHSGSISDYCFSKQTK